MMKNKKQAGEKRGVMGNRGEMNKRKEMKTIGLMAIGIILVIMFMNGVDAVTNITNCQTLSSAGETYTLNISISKSINIHNIMYMST